MSTPCDYHRVASCLVNSQEVRNSLTVTLLSPKAEVVTSFDLDLQNPSLKAKIDLDAVSFDLSSSSGKEKSVSAVVHPNLKVFNVQLDYFPLNNGNFTLSGQIPIPSLATLALSYKSNVGKLSGNLSASHKVGSVQISGKLVSPTEDGVAASIFASSAALSIGGSANIGQTVTNPTLYAKYTKSDLAVSTIISILAGSKVKVDLRAQKGCPCRKEGGLAYGAVVSYNDGKPTLSVGGKFNCAACQKGLGIQLSTDRSFRATFNGKVEQYNTSYSVTAGWSFATIEWGALIPRCAINLTLGQK